MAKKTKQQGPKAKWCFTLNNYPEDWKEKVKFDWMEYLIVGTEVGEGGTPHLQGYFECKPRKRMTALKKLFGKRNLVPHFEAAKGTAEQNKTYCTKQNMEILEVGQPAQQGKRSDLQGLNELALSGASLLSAAQEYPGATARYHKWFNTLKKEARKERALKTLKEQFSAVQLRIWQTRVLDRLIHQNAREILWVWDEIGNTGKTYLGKYIVAMKDAFYCTGGRPSDIAFAYDLQEYIVVDLARSTKLEVPYQTLEEWKNGLMFSPKYDSRMMCFAQVKIVIFANFPPDQSRLSLDRWNVMHVAKPPQPGDRIQTVIVE